MLNGLYGSAASLDALNKMQEATASNLAHLNTPGHRRLVMGFAERMAASESDNYIPAAISGTPAVDFSLGRIQHTGRLLDVAIQGKGFFAFQGANEVMYSRNGVIHRDTASNQLVNVDGFPILDERNQPIVYEGSLANLTISSEGILSSGETRVGQLAVYEFAQPSLLESKNQTYFLQGNATPVMSENPWVLQGSRELSNVNPATEMISLIMASRHFEASQRVIRSISDSMQENIRS